MALFRQPKSMVENQWGGGERRALGEPRVHTSLDAAAACGRQTHRRRVRVLHVDRSGHSLERMTRRDGRGTQRTSGPTKHFSGKYCPTV